MLSLGTTFNQFHPSQQPTSFNYHNFEKLSPPLPPLTSSSFDRKSFLKLSHLPPCCCPVNMVKWSFSAISFPAKSGVERKMELMLILFLWNRLNLPLFCCKGGCVAGKNEVKDDAKYRKSDPDILSRDKQSGECVLVCRCTL